MSVITYTAKRNIPQTGFSVLAAPDISITASDNSINSTFTDLSGLLAGQWVKLTGFVLGVNGSQWHKVLSDATTNKVLIAVESSLLIDESDVLSASLIGYTKGLNAPYKIEFDLKDKNHVVKTAKKTIDSISGISETLFHSQTLTNGLTTTPINEAVIKSDWDTFFSSVAGGESFYIDFEGSIVAPIRDEAVSIVGDPSFTRISNLTLLSVNLKVKML